MPRSPPSKDLHQNWHSGSPRGRNQLCQFFWQLVKGFGFCRGPNFAISHWLSRSPLTQCWRYRAARDDQTNSVNALKETSWSSRSGLNTTRTTPPCYNNTTLGNCFWPTDLQIWSASFDANQIWRSVGQKGYLACNSCLYGISIEYPSPSRSHCGIKPMSFWHHLDRVKQKRWKMPRQTYSNRLAGRKAARLGCYSRHSAGQFLRWQGSDRCGRGFRLDCWQENSPSGTHQVSWQITLCMVW